MAKHKYIETPEILRSDLEFELPFKKNKLGDYIILPNIKHNGGKNSFREIAKKKVNLGHVYFINIVGTNKYKIGVSTNVKRRLADISSVLPFELNILAINEIKNPFHFEEILHNQFKSKLIKNEWFELNIDDVKYIMITLHNQQVKELNN